MSSVNARNIDVVILCGGMGTRLKSILGDSPKSMAKMDKRPFLDILIEHISTFGFERFILCIGYKAKVIREHYRSKKGKLEILISSEAKPLGTGGAIKNARTLIQSDPFLVVNGDSFFDMNLCRFIHFHMRKKALLSIALVDAKDPKDYGSIKINSANRVIRFNEKEKAGRSSIINAGIYLFNSEVLSLMPNNENFSLEYDFFPKIVSREFYGYLAKGLFIDIGTPERYKRAERLLKDFNALRK